MSINPNTRRTITRKHYTRVDQLGQCFFSVPYEVLVVYVREKLVLQLDDDQEDGQHVDEMRISAT